jgi:ribonuclease PH
MMENLPMPQIIETASPPLSDLKRRPSGRKVTELRAIQLECHVNKFAEGSCLVSFGDTKVLCMVSVEEKLPNFRKGSGEGWLTAEYAMLPRSTHSRNEREAIKGRQSGRTMEIQRLIGRALRSVLIMPLLGERTLKIDCDVLQADGGTRTAAITGSYVAVALACQKLHRQGLLSSWPLKDSVAAVSCGLYRDMAVLDLDYNEDSDAQTDANFVITGQGLLVEVQMTAEQAPFSQGELMQLLTLAQQGCENLAALQRAALDKFS